MIILITDVLSHSRRGPQSEVLPGSSLECRLNLQVLGHLHQARSPHINLLRAVATSTYDILFLRGGQACPGQSVGLRSPIDGGHPKSSSHANPDIQLYCVSGRPAAFYQDNASDSVSDFHQYLG